MRVSLFVPPLGSSPALPIKRSAWLPPAIQSAPMPPTMKALLTSAVALMLTLPAWMNQSVQAGRSCSDDAVFFEGQFFGEVVLEVQLPAFGTGERGRHVGAVEADAAGKTSLNKVLASRQSAASGVLVIHLHGEGHEGV